MLVGGFMTVLDEIEKRGHEQVTFFRDPETGILFIVAIHSTVLGPALGGCRVRKYATIEEALYDVLKLSEAMSYKNSLAGLNIGGGKAVIVADHTMKTGRKELFQSFGRFVKSLNGKYVTAEDMGTSVQDMGYILSTCEFVAGRDRSVGGGGDPSPYTAIGLFEGIRSCLERCFDSGDYRGRHFVIQGVGNVGKGITQLLAEAGAKLTLCDHSPKVAAELGTRFGASVVSAETVLSTPCDVFVPCAIGGIINQSSVPTLRCRIVAGAANNQIEGGEAVERALVQRGILYAPDFAINAGGVTLCADELEQGGFTESRVRERVARIYHTLGKIFDESKKTSELPGNVAVRLAKERIEQARRWNTR